MSFEGLQLNGRYQLTRLLGSGGMGDVYVAHDLQQEREVAIKVIRAERAYSGEDAAREEERLFRREAKMIARLNHPRILALYDYGQEQHNNLTLYYLVMPYQSAGSFAEWLRQHGGITQLEPEDAVAIIEQAVKALQHAHDHQVIHQDIKPSNFLVQTSEEDSSRPELILSDFGIAHLSMTTSSASQSIRGTPTYMAPEQWEGHPVYATDQYGLAVMAYELLTGQPPFQGNATRMMYQHLNTLPEPPSSVNAKLAPQVDQVLLRALAKRPAQRFSSVAAFAGALSLAVQGTLSAETLATLVATAEDNEQTSIEQAQPFIEKTGLSYDELAKQRAISAATEEAPGWPSVNSEQDEVVADAKITRELSSGLQIPISGVQRRPKRRSLLLIIAAAVAIMLILAGVTATLALRGPRSTRTASNGQQATQGSTMTTTPTPTQQLAFQPATPTKAAKTAKSHPTPTPMPTTASVIFSNPTQAPTTAPTTPPPPTPIPTATPTPTPTPTPPPTPDPTPIPPPTLSVSPNSFFAPNDCTWQFDEMNGQHGGGTWSCSATLQNLSNTQSLPWSISDSGFPSNSSYVSFSQGNGTLAPGQSTTVSFQIDIFFGGSCYGISQASIIFAGSGNPTNTPWTCIDPTFTVNPINLNAQQDCQLGSNNSEWDCTVTVTQNSQGQVLLSIGGFSNTNVGSTPSFLILNSPNDMVGQAVIYIPTTACPGTSSIDYSANNGTFTGTLIC